MIVADENLDARLIKAMRDNPLIFGFHSYLHTIESNYINYAVCKKLPGEAIPFY